MSFAEFIVDHGFGVWIGVVIAFVFAILFLPGLFEGIYEADAEFLCETQNLELFDFEFDGRGLTKVICFNESLVGYSVFENKSSVSGEGDNK